MTIYSLDVLLFRFGTSLLLSSSNCCFLTCIQISQESGQVVWYSHLLKNFSVCCDPQSQRLWYSQQSRNRCFSGTLLLFRWSNRCWQFDLWFLCFWIQLEHLEVHGSCTVEAWFGEFWALLCYGVLLLLLSRFSRVRLCATPQMAAHQALPSLGFSRQEHWSLKR